MENWREGTRSGHTHEPNDVTIQLDGLGRQLSELDPGEPGRPESTDGPVFVDESGRRSKTYRRVGWVLAAVCAVYAVTLVVAVLGGNSSAPFLPISGQEGKKPAEVEVQPAPARSDSVAGTPGPVPSTTASAPAPTGGTPTSGSVTGPLPAGPGTAASVSAPVAPPNDDGPATKPAAPDASSPAAPDDNSPPVVEPPPPVEESTPPPAETTAPPVQEQEGAQ